MARTYLPTLRDIVTRLCRYIVRYSDALRATLDTAGEAALDSLQAACSEFLATVPGEEIES